VKGEGKIGEVGVVSWRGVMTRLREDINSSIRR